MKKENLVEFLMCIVWIPIIIFLRIKYGFKRCLVLAAIVIIYFTLRSLIGIKHKTFRDKLEKYDIKILRIVWILFFIYAALTGRY